MKRRVFWISGFLVFANVGILCAQDQAISPTVDEKVEALAAEVERLKEGGVLFPPLGEGEYGLAPAASKVYQQDEGISLGGYGEFLYENFSNENESGTPSGIKDEIDALRAILYVGYRFSPKFVFNSEIEFEHGSTSNSGSVSVEFAYIDYLFQKYLNFRAGMLLVPMGWINELHEPTVFLSTERPLTERQMIPTTWREMGMGLFGEWNGFSYRAYTVAGLDAVGGGSSNAGGFSSSGLRGGRQQGSKSIAEDFAFVGRLDYEGFTGLTLGVSGFIGESDQENRTTGGASIDALTSILDFHAEWKYKGFQARGLFAYVWLNDADKINDARGLAGNAGVGSEMMGFYAEAGYNVLQPLGYDAELIPFFRYEEMNTHQKVPSGFTKNPARNQQIYLMGLAFKPIPTVVAKFDYAVQRDDAETGVDQWNLALGYMF